MNHLLLQTEMTEINEGDSLVVINQKQIPLPHAVTGDSKFTVPFLARPHRDLQPEGSLSSQGHDLWPRRMRGTNTAGTLLNLPCGSAQLP